MNPSQFRNYRILFYRASCPHCNRYLQFIERINSRLPINKRIVLVDCEYEKYGIVHPLAYLFSKHYDGYPALFIDGIKKTGINSIIESKAWLESYLHDDFIVSEENEHMFNKDCMIQKGGLFGGKVVCR